MVRLCVNIDHVATVREARKGREPDPVFAAVLAELAGVDGIVCHVREDRRHMKDRDLRILKEVVQTHLNLEMAPTDEMVQLATEVLPDMTTLVPEKRQELTTEGGLDVVAQMDRLADVISDLHAHNIVVSLFIDPNIQEIKASSRVGADYVELHTGEYANAEDLNKMSEQLDQIANMALAASKLGLGVSAGHGLNYQNVSAIAHLNKIEELNIGHSIISRALLVGLDRAIREMKDLIK